MRLVPHLTEFKGSRSELTHFTCYFLKIKSLQSNNVGHVLG